MNKPFVRLLALLCAAIVVAGCTVSIGLTNSPTLPSGPPWQKQ